MLKPCPFDVACVPEINPASGLVNCQHALGVAVDAWNTRHVPELSAEDRRWLDQWVGDYERVQLRVYGLAIVRVKP